MQSKSTPSPPPIFVDLPLSLLCPSDEKPSLPSLETQCLHCSEELSAVLIEASANTNGDCQKNMMLFSPVKRKRSKRVMPELDSEVCAASALLMLSGCASKGCYGGDNNDNISTPNLLKEVNLNASDQLVHCDEFMDNTRPNSDRNSAYEGFYELSEKENTLNLAADVPRTVVLENVFDDGLVDGHAEFMKPEADISLEEAKSSSNLSVAVNIKRYHCEVCGKLLRSECALDVHMRLHREKEKILNLVADIPKKEVLLNVFDHGPDVDAEFMKPGAGSSVEDLKSGDLSAAVKIKSYECKVCGKVLRSGQALGGHMTSHLNRGQENTLNLVADVPKAEVLLNVFDYELDAVAEFKKPGADISVEELKSSDLSAAVNVKRHIRQLHCGAPSDEDTCDLGRTNPPQVPPPTASRLALSSQTPAAARGSRPPLPLLKPVMIAFYISSLPPPISRPPLPAAAPSRRTSSWAKKVVLLESRARKVGAGGAARSCTLPPNVTTKKVHMKKGQGGRGWRAETAKSSKKQLGSAADLDSRTRSRLVSSTQCRGFWVLVLLGSLEFGGVLGWFFLGLVSSDWELWGCAKFSSTSWLGSYANPLIKTSTTLCNLKCLVRWEQEVSRLKNSTANL
ncbi:hypothetical protein HU200_052684 [Digitaria exilis]|uniref:C2H2-type domain-containing protein n=1 Tax=Digitaria exilis TaxID=1010633 RepID=A0A835E3U9_9POAL|nr:hypothetical protein HU200_052684 [Digitaria exilis]